MNQSPFLSDIEHQKLVKFNSDPIMKEAVRKILLKGIYENGTIRAGAIADPLKNFALALAFNPNMPNEILGQHLKAAAEGINAVENAFQKISMYRDEVVDQPGEDINRAL
jgi:hypothetical protein